MILNIKTRSEDKTRSVVTFANRYSIDKTEAGTVLVYYRTEPDGIERRFYETLYGDWFVRVYGSTMASEPFTTHTAKTF